MFTNKIYLDSFTWSRWRKGIIIWETIKKEGMNNIKNKIVGHMESNKLFCRPKYNEIAVMFLINDDLCWTHFRKEEFYGIKT
uniref:Uncharacterized protein n=1 Tax=viral metagenome TaxID=1070528 RepID=A0A6M3LCE3_9ZZZZ